MKELNQKGASLMHIVTKAKLTCVAYKKPPSKRSGRGRSRKKGARVKLKKLFTTRASKFQSEKVSIYGKQETVQYLCLDLL